MEEIKKSYQYIYDENKIIDFFANNATASSLIGKYVNLHFMTSVDDQICLSEIDIIKNNYVEENGLSNVIISCEKQEYLDEWKIKNNFPKNLYLISDYDRQWANAFSILNFELDLPNKLSCLLETSKGRICWSMLVSYNEKRENLELFSEFNSKILKKE